MLLLLALALFIPSAMMLADTQADASASAASEGPAPADQADPAFSEKDIMLLARVVYGEARGESFLGKVAVANVALNRFESGHYGRSLKAIIKRPNQFAIAKRTNKACLEAVRFLIDNDLRILPKNAYYFKTSDHEWRGLVPFCRIGGHMFFTAGDPKLDAMKPYVNSQGILVWPNASLWDEQNRTQFVIKNIFSAGGEPSDAPPDASSVVEPGTVPAAAEKAVTDAPDGNGSGPVIDFNELDRQKAIFEKYEKLLGKDTVLL